MKKSVVPARSPWGDVLGYSRAIRVGGAVFVAGTAPADESGKVVAKGDAYTQTAFSIRKVEAALKELGCSLDDVVRTRIFTTDISRWREIARAHRELLGKAKPVNTMVQVSRLIDPDMLVEVEVEAVARDG